MTLNLFFLNMIRLLLFLVCSIFTSPMHLVFPGPPPSPPSKRKCIAAIIDFSWDDCNTQRQTANNGHALVYYGQCENDSFWEWIHKQVFRLKRTSPKNNLNFHTEGCLADMSGRSIAAIRHKRSKIQRSWPVLEWVQYEWVKACNGLPRITATLRFGIFQNASSNFEYSPLDMRVYLRSQDLR